MKWLSLVWLILGAVIMTARTIVPGEGRSALSMWLGFVWGVLVVFYLRELTK